MELNNKLTTLIPLNPGLALLGAANEERPGLASLCIVLLKKSVCPHIAVENVHIPLRILALEPQDILYCLPTADTAAIVTLSLS